RASARAVRPGLRQPVHHGQADHLQLPRVSLVDPSADLPAYQSQEPSRARLQGKGQHQHPARPRDPEPDRPLQPRHGRPRSRAPFAGGWCPRQGEAPQHADRLSEVRLRARRRQAGDRPVGVAVSDALPVVYLARHGETAWTVSHRHTGRTDLPLTGHGEEEALRLGARLEGLVFAAVLTSPLQRGARTCELAGFGGAEVDPDLLEWHDGAYEGRTSADIHAERPGWELFRDGCPGGESPADVGARADRVARRVRTIDGNVLLFSSGHFLRVFAAPLL